jgi:hypothetical protein
VLFGHGLVVTPQSAAPGGLVPRGRGGGGVGRERLFRMVVGGFLKVPGAVSDTHTGHDGSNNEATVGNLLLTVPH